LIGDEGGGDVLECALIAGIVSIAAIVKAAFFPSRRSAAKN